MPISAIQYISDTYNQTCDSLQGSLNDFARGIPLDTVNKCGKTLLFSASLSLILSGGSLAAAGTAVGFTMVAVVTNIGLNILIKKCESNSSPMVSDEKNALITGLSTAAAYTVKKLTTPYASTPLYVAIVLILSAFSYSSDKQLIPVMLKA